MSRPRGRPRRNYRITVRTKRRATPNYQALARAVLEHAALAKDKPPTPTDLRENTEEKRQ